MVTDLHKVLAALAEAGAQVTIIGGQAMIVHGSAYITGDVDFAFARTRDNAQRIVAALARFEPRPRGFPSDVPFIFDAQTIMSATILTLETNAGDIDLLGEVAGIGTYDNVESAAETFEIDGVAVRVLSLDALITAKRAAGRQKDRTAVIELEALREAIEAPGDRSS